MKRLLVVAIAAMVVAAQSSPSWSKTSHAKVGSKHRSSIKIGNSDVAIPLPGGEWKVIGSDVSVWSIGAKKININKRALAKVVDGKLHGVIYVQSSDRRSVRGYNADKFCDRKNIHHIVNNGNYKKDRDCWGVNHNRFNLWDKAPKYINQSFSWFGKNNIHTPANMIAVMYSVVGGGNYAKIIYFFNPEIEGISPPTYAEWGSSDWHPTKINQFPKKQVYVKKKIAWGKRWHKKVLSAVNK